MNDQDFQEAADSKAAPAFVWYSTPESVEAGTVSILACAETAFAVACYAYIALNWGYLPFWWMSILVAPLLLLRSEESVALGVRWMQSYWILGGDWPEDLKSLARIPTFWLLLVISTLISFILSYFSAKYLLVGLSGIEAFLQGAEIAAIAVTGAVAGAVAIARAHAMTQVASIAVAMAVVVAGVRDLEGVIAKEGAVAGAGAGVGAGAILMLPGFALGIWLRTLAIRFFATVCHLILGARALPSNWKRTLLALDFWHPPELLPHNPVRSLSFYFVRNMVLDRRSSFLQRAAFVTLAIILYVPGLFYRLTIKSTGWFYLPLFYLLYARKRERAADPTEMRDRIMMHPYNWVQFLLAFITIGVGVATAASKDFGTTLKRVGDFGPISALEVLAVLDWSAIRPWQWLTMISAALTIYVLYDVFNLRIDIKHSGKPAVAREANWRAWTIEYVLRARTILTVAWVALLIAHMAVKSPLGAKLPTVVLEPLQRFFAG